MRVEVERGLFQMEENTKTLSFVPPKWDIHTQTPRFDQLSKGTQTAFEFRKPAKKDRQDVECRTDFEDGLWSKTRWEIEDWIPSDGQVNVHLPDVAEFSEPPKSKDSPDSHVRSKSPSESGDASETNSVRSVFSDVEDSLLSTDSEERTPKSHPCSKKSLSSRCRSSEIAQRRDHAKSESPDSLSVSMHSWSSSSGSSTSESNPMQETKHPVSPGVRTTSSIVRNDDEGLSGDGWTNENFEAYDRMMEVAFQTARTHRRKALEQVNHDRTHFV